MTTLADMYLARLRALGGEQRHVEGIAHHQRDGSLYHLSFYPPALVRLVGAWVR